MQHKGLFIPAEYNDRNVISINQTTLNMKTKTYVKIGLLSGVVQCFFFVNTYAESELRKALIGGKASADARLRYEHAEVGSLKDGDALTIRTRLGYGTGDFRGFKAFLEAEDTTAMNDDEDYSVPAPSDQQIRGTSIIADPEGTQINRSWLSYSYSDTFIKLGRQRIFLDNARFIGNVGWRQSEQTYDAVSLTNNSIPDTRVFYGYLDQKNDILYNYVEMDTHLINFSYSGIPNNTLTAYGYLIDFPGAAVNSVDITGVCATGEYSIDDNLSLNYRIEYAYQKGGDDAPVDYEADYYHLSVEGACSGFSLGVGYEVLGSDDGKAGFKTPLATLHAFNGFADLFLSTPKDGLEDIYVAAGYKFGPVPVKLIYHEFESDEGGIDYGSEIDLVASYKISQNTTVLAKYANFESDWIGKPDVDKFWLQLDFKF